MKKDKERGAEDLETFGHICEGVGAAFFGIFGGITIGKGEGINPQKFFYITGFFGILLFIAGCAQSRKSEDGNISRTNKMSVVKDKLKMVSQFVKLNEIRNTLIFFFVVSIV